MKFILVACIMFALMCSVSAVMGADRGRQNDYHKIKTPLYKPEAERNQGKESRVSVWKATATDKVEKVKTDDASSGYVPLATSDVPTASSTAKATYVPEIPKANNNVVSSSNQLVAGALLSGMCALIMI